jgi:hypothetical protein
MDYDTLVNCGIMLIGFVIGWIARERWAVRKLNNMLGHLTTEIETMEAVEADKIHIDIELKDSMIYIYNKETSMYLAHGATKDIVEDMLVEKFPGKKFAASTEDLLKLTQ